MNNILINAIHKEEIRVAITRNRTLVGFDLENNLNKKNKGNIYKGKISRIEESLEAAFVDYGKERQGFLPLKEISDYWLNKANVGNGNARISDIFKDNQEIIVQVEKEERGNKGAALTTQISLVGTYLIYMPTKQHGVSISRQLHPSDRKELQAAVNELNLSENTSIILRTISSAKNKEEIEWEIEYLSGLWRSIISEAKTKPAPFLIYCESDIIIRTIRDYLRDDVDGIIIDDAKTFQHAKEFISFMLPHYLHKIKFFDVGEKSLFSHMGVEAQVNNIFKRKISLPSGATIIFDTTEALTSVDINSARANKGNDIEETAFNTNLEATTEIANQLQLRDVGGLIVIDFIDMLSENNRKAVERTLTKATEKDRARIRIGSISDFGLLEMSRQRVRGTINETTHRICSSCSGHGITPTIPGIALQILRQLENSCNASRNMNEIIVKSTIEVITYLLNEKRHHITQLEIKHNVKILLLTHGYKKFPYYEIRKKTIASDAGFKSYQGISRTELVPDLLIVKPTADVPSINLHKPNTPMPVKQVSILGKIKRLFAKKKPPVVAKKPTHHRNRRHYNKPRNQNKYRRSRASRRAER